MLFKFCGLLDHLARRPKVTFSGQTSTTWLCIRPLYR